MPSSGDAGASIPSRRSGAPIAGGVVLLLGIVILAFAAYTAVVVANHGCTGFPTLAWNEA